MQAYMVQFPEVLHTDAAHWTPTAPLTCLHAASAVTPVVITGTAFCWVACMRR